MAKKKAKKGVIFGKAKGGVTEILVRISKGEGAYKDTTSHACATPEEAIAFINKSV